MVRDSKNNYKNLQQNQNVMPTQNKMSFTGTEIKVKSTSTQNHVKENQALDEIYVKKHNDDVVTVINTDTVPMYNIHKPTIKVNKQETAPNKYDIVTTIKNKLQINNHCVRPYNFMISHNN